MLPAGAPFYRVVAGWVAQFGGAATANGRAVDAHLADSAISAILDEQDARSYERKDRGRPHRGMAYGARPNLRGTVGFGASIDPTTGAVPIWSTTTTRSFCSPPLSSVCCLLHCARALGAEGSWRPGMAVNRTAELYINLVNNSAALDHIGFRPVGVVAGPRGMETIDRLYAGYGEMADICGLHGKGRCSCPHPLPTLR